MPKAGVALFQPTSPPVSCAPTHTHKPHKHTQQKPAQLCTSQHTICRPMVNTMQLEEVINLSPQQFQLYTSQLNQCQREILWLQLSLCPHISARTLKNRISTLQLPPLDELIKDSPISARIDANYGSQSTHSTENIYREISKAENKRRHRPVRKRQPYHFRRIWEPPH